MQTFYKLHKNFQESLRVHFCWMSPHRTEILGLLYWAPPVFFLTVRSWRRVTNWMPAFVWGWEVQCDAPNLFTCATFGKHWREVVFGLPRVAQTAFSRLSQLLVLWAAPVAPHTHLLTCTFWLIHFYKVHFYIWVQSSYSTQSWPIRGHSFLNQKLFLS